MKWCLACCAVLRGPGPFVYHRGGRALRQLCSELFDVLLCCMGGARLPIWWPCPSVAQLHCCWRLLLAPAAGFLTCHLLSHVPWECLSSLLARCPPIHNAWRPWAPKSVADFWGVRWNRTGSAILRWVVYEPVTTGD